MDAKEIKSTLKNAREAIRQKEFKEALRQCKLILSVDKNHYMTLVLVAVAAEGLDQHEQALKAYKRAIDVDSEQPLALQGLCAYYEKNPSPENQGNLPDIYQKLLHAYSGDEGKRMEVMRKLAELYVALGKTDEAVKLNQQLLSLEKDEKKKFKLQEHLISLLEKSSSPESATQLLSLCEEMVNTVSQEDSHIEKIIGIYLSGHMKQCETGFTAVCEKVLERHPQSVSALEYLLISVLDGKIGYPIENPSDEEKEKVDLLSGLTSADDSGVLSVMKGYLALCAGDRIQARDLVSHGLKKCDLFVSAYFIMCVVKLGLHDNTGVLQISATGEKMLQRKDRILSVPSVRVHSALSEIKVRALLAQGTPSSLNKAQQTIEQDLDTNDDHIKGLQGLVFMKQGEVEKAEECICGLGVGSVSLQGKIALHKQQYTEALDRFKAAVEFEPSNGEHLLDMAKCYWSSNENRQECFTSLLKAAKADPYNSEVFLYLGHYYCQVQKDEIRAQKCYQKSFDLDPSNDEAGAQLCDLLTEAGKEEAAHSLLVHVTSEASAGCAKWAWLRLGLYQMKHEDPSVAVASLQAALRADPKDNHVWECLAEAYYHRGSYTASLKAFTKASELDPDSMYCLFQMAAIKQTLGQYTEAITEYKLILDRSPDYVPALKGVGETYLLQARSLLNQFMNGRARDTSQQAILHLTRAVSHRPDLSCLWKLMGDACTILKVLPTETFSFQVPAKLMKKEQVVPDEMVTNNKLETLQLGGRCYGKALKILPECSSLWHDLGVNYFHQSQCSTDGAVRSLAERSVEALKKAISLEPANHKHWNALGFVSCFEGCYQPDLAQHCFIKSIQAEANNVVAWSNLASLYLKNDNVELAHKAFKAAQSLEPSYVASWIGQAMIAEIIGDDDAMDLFRHTTELGNHLEAALGYGHWVCSMLLNKERQNNQMYRYAIEQMSAIPAASDVLARYTDQVKTNAKAYNMHGLLLEHQKLYKTAKEAFQRAVSLLEDNPERLQELQDVRCNYARVLCKCELYKEAVDMFALMAEVNDFFDVCQMALALYKVGQLQESFQAYSKAASLATSEAEKSHVFAAIAMVSYKFGDQEGTKTALFQSSQVSQPSLWGLEALCALGLLQADITLASAALQELFKIEDTDGHLVDILKLAVSLSIAQGDMLAAKHQIQRHLHRNPMQASLWQLLSGVLLQFYPQCGQAATSSAQCAKKFDWNQCKESLALEVSGQLTSGLHGVGSAKSNNALSSAQRLIHLYPDKLDHLVSLASALHAEAIMSDSADTRQSLLEAELVYLKHIITRELTVELRLWCFKQMVVCALHAGKPNIALEILEMILTQFGSSGEAGMFFEVFKNVLQKNTTGLLSVVANDDTLYYWQLLVEIYAQAGLKQEVKMVLQQCLNAEQFKRNRPAQLSCLLKLMHFSFLEFMDGREDLPKQTFEETAKHVLQLDPDCAVAHLMQSAATLQDNLRLSKHHIQGVLSRRHCAGSRSHDLSLARRILIYILHTSKKDPDTIKVLMTDAEASDDQVTMLYHKQLTSKDN